MGEQASVESFEALSSLRMALTKFVDSASSVLYTADAHLQRTKTWIKSEQTNYWTAEGRKRAELLIRAKLTLKEKKLSPTPLGGRPSCVEEEKAVKLATRRVEEAEQKARNVKLWSRRIDEEGLAYSASATGMKHTCTAEIPAAIARLDHMLAALQAYATHGPEMQGSVAASSTTSLDSMSRGTPTEQTKQPDDQPEPT